MLTLDSTLSLAKQIHQSGDFETAERAYRQALLDDPSQTEAWYLLGRACQSQGKWNEAIFSYQHALTFLPDLAEAHSNLGIAMGVLGRGQDAMACYRQAIRLRPDYVEAHNNLGNALDRQGRSLEATDSLRTAVRLRPDFAEGHNNLGIALKNLRAWPEAIASLREAVRLRPDFAEAHCNLGIVLAELRRDDEAMASYQRALDLKPDLVPALCGRGQIAVGRGDLAAGNEFFRDGLRHRPDSPDLWSGLGFVLAESGLLTEGMNAYRESIRLQPDSPSTWSNYLFHQNYDPETNASTLLEEHRRWGRLLEQTISTVTVHQAQSTERRPLRVGYISPDFRLHAVASFLEPILANHDRNRVEVYCYSDVGSPDATTARLRGHAQAWREIRPLNDQAVEEMIRRDRIDILVDLAGHTARNRLAVFARKPAPVQLTYLGYPEPTGLSTIDALITDDIIDPVDQLTRPFEIPLRVPGTFCCFEPPIGSGEVTPLPWLQAGFPTFGSLHKLPKLNPQVIDLWSRLLQAIPGSRLILVRDRLKGRRGQEIVKSFEARGVEPGRVQIRSDWNTQNHWDHYASIDLSLDAFPWSGHTTACESLWMGVPVVTLIGDRRSSRLTASVLNAMDLSDLITRTPEQYIETAARWVEDPQRLARWRKELRDLMRASALCDGRSFTIKLEQAYESFWDQRINETRLVIDRDIFPGNLPHPS